MYVRPEQPALLITIAAACTIVVASIFAYVSITDDGAGAAPMPATATTTPNQQALADTDGDGTPDWEERLRGTDPATYDRAAPASTTIASSSLAERQRETYTPPSFDPDQTDGILDVLRTRLTADTQQTDTANTAALREYGNAAGDVLQTHLDFQADQSVLAALVQQATTSAPVDARAVSAVADRYAAAARELAGIQRPASIAQAAEPPLRKATADVADTLTALADRYETYTDFVTALRSYDDAARTWSTTFRTLRETFRNAGVQFGPDEPGYIFTRTL